MILDLELNIVFLNTVGTLGRRNHNDYMKAETPSFRTTISFSSWHAYIVQKYEFMFKINNVQSYHTLSKLAFVTLLCFIFFYGSDAPL